MVASADRAAESGRILSDGAPAINHKGAEGVAARPIRPLCTRDPKNHPRGRRSSLATDSHMAIETASVAEVKARSSKYLALVRLGGEVVVTNRGVPVARLTGLAGDAAVDARTARLLRAGYAAGGSGSVPPAFWDRPWPEHPQGRSLAALLDERRTEHGTDA